MSVDGAPDFHVAQRAGGAQPDAFRQAPTLEQGDQALLALGQLLRDTGYQFTTVTPLTHLRVLARTNPTQMALTDIFGWSRPFHPSDLPKTYLHLLQEADAVVRSAELLRSSVRFSTLGAHLFVHSAFPTEDSDAVFFGPDTYRFAGMLRNLLRRVSPNPMRVLDVGAGTGAGGLYAGTLLGADASIVLSDINRRALRFCRINAALNGCHAEVVESDLYESVGGAFDLIISNPPYLIDPHSRLYRHGGGSFGEALSVAIAFQGIDRLVLGGRLLLYTGTAIVGGTNCLHEAMKSALGGRAVRFTFEEIDPDVFGEELEHPPYDRVDRIAVIAVAIESLEVREVIHECSTHRLDPLGRRD